MGQTATTENIFSDELAITLPVHVVVLNNYKFSDNINIVASKSPNYTIRHLLQTTIKTLQQIHQPTTYHVHYMSFNIKSNSEYNQYNHSQNHIESQLYYSKDTKQFSQILKSKITNKESFKFKFLTECDIEIPITVTCLFNSKYNINNFKLSVWYNNNHFIRDILNDIIFYINSKHKHDANITFENVFINEQSFCKNSQKNYPITHYKNIHSIHNIGLNIHLISKQINCPYIIGNQNEMINNCPIYLQMIKHNKFTIENYKHLFIFNHFEDRFMWTEECPNSYNCQSYVRLKNGGNKLNDKCHLKLYKHPIIKLGKRYQVIKQNVSDFFKQENNGNDIEYFPVYLPSFGDEEEYNLSSSDNEINGYLEPLILEVINNGFRNDLYLNNNCNNMNDGNNNKNNNETYPIMQYVNEKMDLFSNMNSNNEKYKLNKGEMLALILYLNSECMFDLSEQQLNGNYMKWKWFDRCLYDAIDILSKAQYGSYKVYLCSEPINYIFNELHSEKTLLNPHLDINIQKKYKNKCFKTYLIASKYKQVQLFTMNTNELDVLIEINKSFKSAANKCCDISWISKFPDQYEMIMQRSTTNKDVNKYKLKCQMTKNGIQTVSIYQ